MKHAPAYLAPVINDTDFCPISTLGRVTEVATRMANQIPGEGNSVAFKQFVWLYVNLIARTLTALGMNPSHVLVYQYAADLDVLAEQYFRFWLDREHPNWQEAKEKSDADIEPKVLQNRQEQTGRTIFIIQIIELLQKQGWKDPIANGLVAVLSNSKTKYQALINSLFPLLEKLTTGEVSELMSHKAMGTSAPILVEYQEFCTLKAKHTNALEAGVVRCMGLIDKAGRSVYVVSARSKKDNTVWILRTKHHETPRCILNFDVAVNILLEAGFKEVTVTL